MKKLLFTLFITVLSFVVYGQTKNATVEATKKLIAVTDFIWKGNIMQKDSIVYVQMQGDSIRFHYINGQWSGWYSGPDNYIQNQNTSAQTANAWINGDLKITGFTNEGYAVRTHSDGSLYAASATTGAVYKGTWNATTNIPTLADGSGTAGWYYRVTTAGTTDFGSGNITFAVGDDVSYNGTIWEKIPAATITGNAITKTDDTNVTLTLGGSHATALLNSASFTLGWTGTLADNRIASATNWNSAYSNRISSLTTTGSSGAATLISNVLNVPNYTLAGLGFSDSNYAKLNAQNTFLTGNNSFQAINSSSGYVQLNMKGGSDTGDGWGIVSNYPSTNELAIRRLGILNALIFAGSGAATFHSTVNSTGYKKDGTELKLDAHKSGALGPAGYLYEGNGTATTPDWVSKSSINLSEFNNNLEKDSIYVTNNSAWYKGGDTLTINTSLYNDSIQALSGTSTTWNLDSGRYATLTLSGNTVITLLNVNTGTVGTIFITNPATIYGLKFYNYDVELGPNIDYDTSGMLCSGSSKFDSFSFVYDGSILHINGNFDCPRISW